MSVDCPLLSSPRLFICTPHRRRPVLPLASNGLNRLARCQGEGAFCGSVANLPGKTQTICSERGLSGDEGVNSLAPSRRPSWPHTQERRVQRRSSRSASASRRRAAVQTATAKQEHDENTAVKRQETLSAVFELG